MEAKWVYQGQVIDSEDSPLIEKDAIGFVYKITKIEDGLYGYNDTKIYIGKKLLTSNRKKVLSKRNQAKQAVETGDKRKVKKVTRVIKSSGWLSYESSCGPLKEDIKLYPELYRKEIIEWCWSKKNLSYSEEKYQHQYKVLETDSWNDNIAGKFWKHDTNKELYEKYREEQKNKPKKARVYKVNKTIPY